jgi:7-carboxy-7-deazaguanine synthase
MTAIIERARLTKYRVNDVYPAIQGEGCLTGTAMVLLRLHGCEVGCPFCDTKETWETLPENNHIRLSEALGTNNRYATLLGVEISTYIRRILPGPKWILLTGGEPADQPLRDLVDSLHDAHYRVSIETSGTATGHLNAGIDWICVSPKINMPGGRVVLPEAVEVADEVKFVIGRERDLEIMHDFLATYPLKPGAQICLQPMSTNQKATELCIETVLALGYRLSVQTHKLLDLR